MVAACARFSEQGFGARPVSKGSTHAVLKGPRVQELLRLRILVGLPT
jgi:hypothetical protein